MDTHIFSPVTTDGAQTIDPESAVRALDYLREVSPDLRGAAILDSEGNALAASGDPARWAEVGRALLDAADKAAGADGHDRAEQVHVATEDGEAFALRHDDLAAVAATERFVLASLMLFDMRAVLRDLARGAM
jgi:predicted regulator of Ras-like GTPase activity (Roadblock/LC7/MglB family)